MGGRVLYSYLQQLLFPSSRGYLRLMVLAEAKLGYIIGCSC